MTDIDQIIGDKLFPEISYYSPIFFSTQPRDCLMAMEAMRKKGYIFEMGCGGIFWRVMTTRPMSGRLSPQYIGEDRSFCKAVSIAIGASLEE